MRGFLFDLEYCYLYIFWGNSIFFVKVKSYNQNKMNTVNVVEVYVPLSFAIACFYWNFRKNWCLLTKCIAMNPENHWVKNFCLKFLYFCFYHNEYLVTKIASSSKLPLNPTFLYYVFVISGKVSLNLFSSEYLDQISPWKELKEAISVKRKTEDHFFFA